MKVRMRVIKQALRGTVDPMVLTDEEVLHMKEVVGKLVEQAKKLQEMDKERARLVEDFCAEV